MERQMIKEYQVEVKGQYWSKPELLWIEAGSKAEAISKLRRKARIEMWYDKYNDGRITWK